MIDCWKNMIDENYHFFLPIYPKIVRCQEAGYHFTVDHNLPTVDHDLPWSPYNFFPSDIPYDRSIIIEQGLIVIYHPGIFSAKHCLFCVRNSPWTVDHNLPSIPQLDISHQKLKRISDVDQAYVRYPYQEFICLLRTFQWLAFSPKNF